MRVPISGPVDKGWASIDHGVRPTPESREPSRETTQ
jgi:hypothetical protein